MYNMSAINQVSTDESECRESFKAFLFGIKRNRRLGWSILSIIVLQFTVFKYFYPYASYIHGDSFVYIDTAYENLSINTYMIGYSMFLRLLSVFFTSDWLTTFLQYALLQASALFLVLSVFYFYRPARPARVFLLVFTVLNPLFLYMGNMISSDAYFLTLSLTWFALMIWIMHRPSVGIVVAHVLILFIAFTVRYNALIYLFIAVIAFWLSPMKKVLKWKGLGCAAMLIGFFVFQTSSHYKKLTGYWQYSPFAGWQMANNAMYAYRYVDSRKREPVPKKFNTLDNMVRNYFDTTKDIKRHPEQTMLASTVYMWDPSSPLYAYRNGLFKKDSTATELKKWSSMGPFYNEYGWYLIKTYPKTFAVNFIWPNANKYYAPPVEFLQVFNSGKDSIPEIARYWFHYKTLRITPRTKSLNIHLLDFYPILSGIINLIILFGLFAYWMLSGYKMVGSFRQYVLLAGATWVLNAGFTIFASSAALRFQSFPIFLTTVSACLLMDWLAKMAGVGAPREEKSKLEGKGEPAVA